MFDRIEKFRQLGPQPDQQIIITLDDERYHHPKCDRILGETKMVPYRRIVNLFVDPCSYCFALITQDPKFKPDNYYEH